MTERRKSIAVSETLSGLIGDLTPEDRRALVKEGLKLQLDHENRVMETERQEGAVTHGMEHLRRAAQLGRDTDTNVEAEIDIGSSKTGDRVRVRITKGQSVKSKLFGG